MRREGLEPSRPKAVTGSLVLRVCQFRHPRNSSATLIIIAISFFSVNSYLAYFSKNDAIFSLYVTGSVARDSACLAPFTMNNSFSPAVAL